MLKIGYSASAGHTPAFALIAEGWNDLVQNGFTPDGYALAPTTPATEVLYAEQEDGEIVGVLCFERLGKVFDVTLAFVEETSRRQGFLHLLWETLLVHAHEAHALKLTSRLHPDNTVGQAVMRKLEAPIAGLVYEKLLGG